MFTLVKLKKGQSRSGPSPVTNDTSSLRCHYESLGWARIHRSLNINAYFFFLPCLSEGAASFFSVAAKTGGSILLLIVVP